MTRLLTAALVALLLLIAAPLRAQDAASAQINHDAWAKLSETAQAMIEKGQAGDAELQDLRAKVVDWRDRFQQAQNTNATRISTLKDQIAALGPVPKEGETEPEDVAARREELNDQLAELQAPRLAAVEAFSAADAMTQQIDKLQRERQANALMRLSPSPLNPGNWPSALSEGARLVESIASDARRREAERGGWSAVFSNAPEVIGYLLAALILLTYGRRWVDSLPARLSRKARVSTRAVLGFGVSLGQILIPLMGIYLAISALAATGFPGEWSIPFLNTLPLAGLIFFGGRWLARQTLPRQAVAYETLSMPERSRNAIRFAAIALAALAAVHHVLARAVLPLSGFHDSPDENYRVPMQFAESAAAVWHFPLILLGALLIFRIGNVLRRLPRWAQSEQVRYRVHILSITGTFSRLIAVAAVLAAAIGYVSAANALIWPWAYTLGLIMLLILLQDLIADLFDFLSRGKEGAREGLAPVLIGFALVLLSLPLFALIWGARLSDLSEAWVRVQNGFSIGGITLSPTGVLTFLIVFAIGYALTRVVQGAFRNTILPKTRLDAGGQNAAVSGLGYLGIFLSAVIAITSAGIDLSSLAIVAGALSVGIGFGLQNIVSNFVSGIILLIERPISVGDWIQAGGQQGIVKRISVRSTSVETFDKTEVIVPNADLVSQPVTNWTRSNQTGRIIIPVGVAYGTDTRKVERILREIVEDQPLVTVDPAPLVLFRGFGADSLDFEVRAILADITSGLGVTSEICHQIAERFADEGIEIPFAQRDIWLRNPEALRPGAAPTAPAQPAAPREAAGAKQPQQIDPRLAMDDADGDGDGDS